MNAARAHGATVLLVLGQTPGFHSTRPGTPGTYGPGAASMPTETSWKSYVYAVVRHFKGRGVDYQVWNEANVAGYWQGTPKQMATLTRLASTIVNRNDSSAKVVSPAMAVRLSSQRSWLRTFYAQKTGGKKVAAYVDVVSLNLYPLASQKPEASMTLLARPAARFAPPAYGSRSGTPRSTTAFSAAAPRRPSRRRPRRPTSGARSS